MSKAHPGFKAEQQKIARKEGISPKAAGAIEKQAAYIIRAASPDLGRRSLEGSRPASSA